jgi:hypothetical protein
MFDLGASDQPLPPTALSPWNDHFFFFLGKKADSEEHVS